MKPTLYAQHNQGRRVRSNSNKSCDSTQAVAHVVASLPRAHGGPAEQAMLQVWALSEAVSFASAA